MLLKHSAYLQSISSASNSQSKHLVDTLFFLFEIMQIIISVYQVCSNLNNIFILICDTFSLQTSFLSVFATPNIPVIQTLQLTL